MRNGVDIRALLHRRKASTIPLMTRLDSLERWAPQLPPKRALATALE